MNPQDDRPARDICATSKTDETDIEKYRERLLAVAGLSELFRVLADESRTKILYLLADGELCVHHLAEVLDLTLPTVSHHLRLLKLMRLVKSRRDGKHVYYSLIDDHIVRLIQVAQEHYQED